MPWLLFHEIPKRHISDEKISDIHEKIESGAARSIKQGIDVYKPLIFGHHQVKMKIPGKTIIWESASGLDTYRKILTEFVLAPLPAFFTSWAGFLSNLVENSGKSKIMEIRK
ncbi:hypothetical protein QUF76_01910 [Desulfobacterales bacterium HSG16]|nr:hypothetical protein [Desulfobacterales bacterium HSG16]